ncbi:eukaryotic aspartyl protease, putative [Eimeria tenella]|uniref:Eukaryotic aspartyl protease, putative n=1 Tax=Eimeria tenella TaxID=5802 RepID=U6KZU4_EIMTE|nr:eukaryotic aspartyl protease, putative [Eimeria tenella]CDJ43461.1 eukaryotic aspartyl protease, putative [Eimeria tenella]|eukprot:XP_013234211.1 eukaryotic aspartyl protease, putative [Eimeria tenella]
MASRGFIREPVFSLALPADLLSEGEITFGGFNSHHFYPEAKIAWFPLISQSRWELGLWDVRVDEASLGLCSPQAPCSAVVDSGTAGVGVSGEFAEQLLNRIGAFSFCNSTEKSEMKRLSFLLAPFPGEDPTEFALDPPEYFDPSRSVGPSPDCPVAFMPLQLPPGQGHTFVRPQRSARCCHFNSFSGIQVLGNVFLRKLYAVFDHGRARIGEPLFTDSSHSGSGKCHFRICKTPQQSTTPAHLPGSPAPLRPQRKQRNSFCLNTLHVVKLLQTIIKRLPLLYKTKQIRRRIVAFRELLHTPEIFSPNAREETPNTFLSLWAIKSLKTLIKRRAQLKKLLPAIGKWPATGWQLEAAGLHLVSDASRLSSYFQSNQQQIEG